MIIEQILPSGANLKITLGTFSESKNLYQVMLEEAKSLSISENDEIDVNLFKNIFCLGLSSKKIEQALKPCLARCLYNNFKIDENTFEPVEARQDYIKACFYVAKENMLPFGRGLYAEFLPLLEKLKILKNPVLRPETMTETATS